MKKKNTHDEEYEEYEEYERRVLKNGNILNLLGIFVVFLGAAFFVLDGSTPVDENYSTPIKISAHGGRKIVVELVSEPERIGRYAGGHKIIPFLHYEGETYRCSCYKLPWCNDSIYKMVKNIYLQTATISIANGKLKRKFIRGNRYCQIIEWEYLLQKDRDLIETLNKRSK